jgi:hypothetical protein
MLIKIHKSYRDVVALCDSDLLGKRFEEGKRQIEMKDHFFKGQEVSKEEAIKQLAFQLREDSTFNIVGKESTKAAIEAGIFKEEDIDFIDQVPFALKLI